MRARASKFVALRGREDKSSTWGHSLPLPPSNATIQSHPATSVSGGAPRTGPALASIKAFHSSASEQLGVLVPAQLPPSAASRRREPDSGVINNCAALVVRIVCCTGARIATPDERRRPLRCCSPNGHSWFRDASLPPSGIWGSFQCARALLGCAPIEMHRVPCAHLIAMGLYPS